MNDIVGFSLLQVDRTAVKLPVKLDDSRILVDSTRLLPNELRTRQKLTGNDSMLYAISYV